ncbi:N-acetyltransferase [Heterostelium album PN500]|uniref:N-acetyltransferase n=1 Tax=Heterostelium pallidum (strain ATCC 26659 / Pp 5 / PN500) TaxID=670386 RepID=D3BAS2_HETP5|nr:N-acetyltransferase [Heterostelium album PN500]EFA81659.1 N-acetyltransferase [Heterostelium album PN500]|eukprot:XP_020433776.1 N-acetyltransferase [Heterostelium album PN500]
MNKINAIFQALDSQNYKNALKLCNAFLQKKADHALVIVLKALSLQKLGETDEAVKLADSIAFQGQVDENVISNLNYFYRSVNQLDKMCRVWEASYKKFPKLEKLAQGVFLSFSKVRDLKNQKEYSVILSKEFNTPRNSFWYLMTLLTMAMENPTNLNLQLTERLADKLATEGKFSSTEELFIYETILETQNKYQKYLEIMKGKLGDLYNYQPDKLKQLAKIYEKLEMYKEASESYKEIVTKYEPDEWSCFIGYFNSMEKIEGVDKNEIFEWIKTQQANMNVAKPIRAPFIAELELANRQKQKLDDLIVSYFKRFGSKPVCFYDLKSYLVNYESLPLEQRQQLVDNLTQLLVSDADAASSPNKSSERVLQLANIYRVHRALGLQYGMSAADTDKLVATLLDEYEKNRVSTAATQQISEPDKLGQFNSIPSVSFQLPTEEQRAKYTFNQDLQVQDQWNSTTYKQPLDATPTPGINSFTWNSNQQTLIEQLISRRLILALIVASKITVNPTKGASPHATNYAELLEKLSQQFTKLPSSSEFNLSLYSTISQLFSIYHSLRVQLSTASSITLENIESNVQSLFNQFIENLKSLRKVICGSVDLDRIRMLTTHLELMTWALFVLSELNKVIPSKKQKKKDEVQVELRKRFDQFIKDLQSVGIKDIETDLASLEQSLSKLNITNSDNQQQQLPPFIDLTGTLSTIEENSLQIKKQIAGYLSTLNSLTKFE